jgi:hypothetical protein
MGKTVFGYTEQKLIKKADKRNMTFRAYCDYLSWKQRQKGRSPKHFSKLQNA